MEKVQLKVVPEDTSFHTIRKITDYCESPFSISFSCFDEEINDTITIIGTFQKTKIENEKSNEFVKIDGEFRTIPELVKIPFDLSACTAVKHSIPGASRVSVNKLNDLPREERDHQL